MCDGVQQPQGFQLNHNIAERCCFHRACLYRKAAAVCRHLAKQTVFCTAAQNVQGRKCSTCYSGELLYRIAVFQSKTFINAAHYSPHRFRDGLAGFAAKFLYSARQVAGGNKFRGIRVNKTAQRFGGKCLLLQLRERICLPAALVLTAAFLNQPKTDDIFQIIDFPVCTEFIGQPALAAIRRQNRGLQFRSQQAPCATGEKCRMFGILLGTRHSGRGALCIMPCHRNDFRTVCKCTCHCAAGNNGCEAVFRQAVGGQHFSAPLPCAGVQHLAGGRNAALADRLGSQQSRKQIRHKKDLRSLLQQFRVLLTQSQQLEQSIDYHDLIAGMGIQFFCRHTGSGLFRFAIRSGIAVMNRVCQQMAVRIQ